jgi:TonB family protein
MSKSFLRTISTDSMLLICMARLPSAYCGDLSELSDPEHPIPMFRPVGELDEIYSPIAKQQSLQGDVFLAFSIDKSGHATGVSTLYSAEEPLAAVALKALQSYRFDVPTTWDEESQVWRRFRIMFHFRIGGCGGPIPPQKPGISEVTIRGC